MSPGVELRPNTQPPPLSSKRHETSVGKFTMMSPGDGKETSELTLSRRSSSLEIRTVFRLMEKTTKTQQDRNWCRGPNHAQKSKTTMR